MARRRTMMRKPPLAPLPGAGHPPLKGYSTRHQDRAVFSRGGARARRRRRIVRAVLGIIVVLVALALAVWLLLEPMPSSVSAVPSMHLA